MRRLQAPGFGLREKARRILPEAGSASPKTTLYAQDFKVCADLNPYTAMRTLILDDEEPIVTLLGRICSGEGHEVSTFTSSTQALGFLANEPVDLLITDMNMPGPDGVEVVR